MSEDDLPSTQPYLLRALHEWCTDNGLTPHLAVKVDGSVQVPPEFVRDGQIVLNISYDATAKLQMGNEFIEFQARFGGVARQIVVPVNRVMAIFARENNQGMAFSVPDSVLGNAPTSAAEVSAQTEDAGEDASEAAKVQRLRKADAGKAQADKTQTGAEGDAGDDDPPPPAAPSGKDGKRPSLRLVK